MYILTLTNKQTNEVHTYDNVIDINAGEKLYYRFQIDTLGLVDGEYDLELTKDGILVGVNTLYVGDYETYSLQYKRGDNTFIDITLNAKLEDATAEINVEKFTLLPSEGYDGFSKVEIDATPLYDVAFGDGYASGSTDGVSRGIEIQKELLESIVINENGTYTREDGYNSVVVNVPDLNGDYQTGYDEGYADGVENGLAEELEKLPILDITENGEYRTINKGVNVNVVPKINVAENGIKFAYSTFTEVPDFYDFSNITDMNNMFANCGNLITIPEMDTSNVTDMATCFQNCYALQSIPLINTSNVTNMALCFQNCSALQSLPELNSAKVDNISYYFRGAGDNLTDVGGWVGLKINWDDNYGLARCPNLTYQSCINILNGLANVTELGGRTLKVHQNFIDTVGDEISIGTNKGWTITA